MIRARQPVDDDDVSDRDMFDAIENPEFEFDCSAFWDGTGWFCPMQGTEECDWECGR